MNERVSILRKLYPNYLILVKHKDKIKFVGIDKSIVDIFGFKKLKNVNKLLLDNLDIKILEEYDNNLYEKHYIKIKLLKIVNILKEGLKDEKKINNY